jgi:hypothetical protein
METHAGFTTSESPSVVQGNRIDGFNWGVGAGIDVQLGSSQGSLGAVGVVDNVVRGFEDGIDVRFYGTWTA